MDINYQVVVLQGSSNSVASQKSFGATPVHQLMDGTTTVRTNLSFAAGMWIFSSVQKDGRWIIEEKLVKPHIPLPKKTLYEELREEASCGFSCDTMEVTKGDLLTLLDEVEALKAQSLKV